MRYHIRPSQLAGEISIPPSKSHSMRAILFASLAKGSSVIRDYLHSPDTEAMIKACQLLGADIKIAPQHLTITGIAGKPQTPNNIIDAGNSGQVLRFIAAIASLNSGYTVITGDDSIRNNRPILPLLEGLTGLGAQAISTQGNGSPPIIIKGPLQGGETHLDGADSQPVSGLLIAAAFAAKPSIIHVSNPGEKPWIDLTLDWFKRLNIPYEQRAYQHYLLPGNTCYAGFDYKVPGDFSSCAFPLVAGLITNSSIALSNVDMLDIQGDKALIYILQAMGANITIEKSRLVIEKLSALNGASIDVNPCIDALTILAVAACFAKNATVIGGAAIARTKESNRLAAITQELTKMGANISELSDGLLIKPALLKGAVVNSHHDHRIAMSLAVAALAADGESIIENTACVAKSYPAFAQSLQQLGAAIEVDHE